MSDRGNFCIDVKDFKGYSCDFWEVGWRVELMELVNWCNGVLIGYGFLGISGD